MWIGQKLLGKNLRPSGWYSFFLGLPIHCVSVIHAAKFLHRIPCGGYPQYSTNISLVPKYSFGAEVDDMTTLIQIATAITNLYNLCVDHKVISFIPEGPTRGLEHLVSKHVCKDVILRFYSCLGVPLKSGRKRRPVSITTSGVLPLSNRILAGGRTLG